MPAEIKNPTPLKVGSSNVVADVEIAKEHDIKVNSRNFILGSAAAYGLGSGTEIPEWLNAAITAEIASGTVDLVEVVEALNATIRGIDEGVQQQITSLQTQQLSTHTLLTTNVSRLDNDVAAVVDLTNTKVTDTEASTLALNVLTAQFADPGSEAAAWFTSSNSATATAVGANASSIDGLIASYNDVNVKLLTTNYVDISGEQWEVGSSKLAIGPDGSVTGWQFNDGTALKSTFAIAADHFYIQNSSIPGYKPFEVDGTDVLFNGKVTFTNVTDVPSFDAKLFVKADHLTFTTVNNGEFYLHGAGTDGLYADVDGSIDVDGTEVTITKGVTLVSTAFANTTQYIVARTDGLFWNTDKTTVVAKYNGGVWEYDTNAGIGSLTPNASMYVIGTVSIGIDPEATAGTCSPILWNNGIPIANIAQEASDGMAKSNFTNTTIIDGGNIITGSMNANRISAGVIYNTGGSAVSYTMKIDLDTGSIHIQ